ncbi:hypothetical protein ES707_14401 [subsurface metagenome]
MSSGISTAVRIKRTIQDFVFANRKAELADKPCSIPCFLQEAGITVIKFGVRYCFVGRPLEIALVPALELA